MSRPPIPVSCKLGTIPALVYLWGNAKPVVGKTLKFREATPGSTWETGVVDCVNADGYFFVSRL